MEVMDMCLLADLRSMYVRVPLAYLNLEAQKYGGPNCVRDQRCRYIKPIQTMCGSVCFLMDLLVCWVLETRLTARPLGSCYRSGRSRRPCSWTQTPLPQFPPPGSHVRPTMFMMPTIAPLPVRLGETDHWMRTGGGARFRVSVGLRTSMTETAYNFKVR